MMDSSEEIGEGHQVQSPDGASDNGSDSDRSDSENSDDSGFMIVQAAAISAIAAAAVALNYASPYYNKTPYHTSALQGAGWVQELLQGHPKRIRKELGVHKHVFIALVEILKQLGSRSSRNIMLDEQLAIFLYISVTGISISHACERFQHSIGTMSKYFTKMVRFFSSPPFYTAYVRPPHVSDPVPIEIQSNPKFYPFFKDAIGAIDGTHINCYASSAAQRQAARDRKGAITQNCLAACSFDMTFYYIFSGWDGAANDSMMYHDARVTDLRVPPGKYYLADAGFPTCDALVVPIRGTRYHLQEWGRANVRPANPDELFNLRHASARNVVERIFGVLKRRFRILMYPAELNMDIQARIPAALAALHNFICQHDPDEIVDFQEVVEDPTPGAGASAEGELSAGIPRTAERNRANARREQIAQDMWVQYQEELVRRGVTATS